MIFVFNADKQTLLSYDDQSLGLPATEAILCLQALLDRSDITANHLRLPDGSAVGQDTHLSAGSYTLVETSEFNAKSSERGDPGNLVYKAISTPHLIFPKRRKSTASERGNDHRDASFRYRLFSRDRTCVLTDVEDPDELQAAHILPVAWRGRESELPSSTFAALVANGGLNSPQNGLLLEKKLHDAFDAGHWCVVPDNEGYKVFAVDAKYRRDQPGIGILHNRDLRLPSGSRNNRLWSMDFVPAALFKFHMIGSIFKNMRGGGEKDDEDYYEEEDIDQEDVGDSNETLFEFISGMLSTPEGKHAMERGLDIDLRLQNRANSRER